ncbi:MAG: tetratricopeptide repeat protein, partial [Planctomycetota bacterium]
VAERDGQPQEAIALAEEARTLVADDATTEQRNAIDEAVFDLLLRNDATVKATAVAEDLGRRGADGAGGDLYRVRIQVAEGDLDEATRQVKALANRFPRMAEAQMALSEVLRRVGDNAGAADAARQALSLAPTDVRAIIEAATAFEAAGRADDAQSVIQQGLVQRPRDPRLRQLDETLTLRYGDAEPVLADRRRAVEENPDDATAWQRLAAAQAAAVENAVRGDDAALRAERVRATVDTALQGLEKFPDDGRFLAQLARVGRLAEDEGIQDRVREAVQRVMTPSFEETLIDDASAVGAAATYYANVDDLQSAIIVVRRHLGRLSADAPREQRAFMLLALSQLLTRGGQNEEAASVLVGFEDVPQVQQRLVAMLAQQATQATGEEQDRLFERLADAVSGDDVQPGPLLAAAFAELNRGNAERAVELLERADRIRPDDAGTIYLLGVALGQLNPPDLEGARDQLERAAELRPTNLDAYRNLARVYQQLGERDAAEDAYLRLLEVDDADLNARLALIQMQLAKSPPDYAAADRYFRAAEATAVAGSPTLLIARARMEMDRNRATDAVTYGRRSVEASVDARRALAGNASPTAQELQAANIPNFLNAYLDLLLRSGRISEAIREIDFWSSRVTASGTEEPHWLQVRRAEAFARDGRRTEARDAYIRAFNTAAATDPGQADVVLLEMAKRIDPDSAYALVQDRVEGDQSDAQATMSAAMIAARIYIQANENDRALGFIRKVRQVFADEGQEIRDSTEILLSQQEGTLYLTNTPPQLDDAASAFRRALELAPDNVAVNNNLAYTLTLLADASEESDMGKERLLRQAVERGDVALATARDEARRRGGVASPSVIDTVGWARAKLAMTTGDDAGLDEAIRLLRTARDNAERDGNAFPEVYVHLARALRADGNLSDAIESARVGLDFVTRRLDNAEERRPGDEQLLNEVRDLIREMENEADAAAAQEGVE